MNRPQIQSLSEAAILVATDKLAARVPELADATFVRSWTISTIAAASSDAITGHRGLPTASAVAQAVAYTTFHARPLSLGNTALGALLTRILLATSGEEVSFVEMWKLVKSGTQPVTRPSRFFG